MDLVANELLRLFPGDTEMAKRMRAYDWSSAPLGPPQRWPHSLKTAISIVLYSRYPMFVWWGDDLIQFYNDGYSPMLGQRHPSALGRPARDTWSDVWPVVGPQTELVLRQGASTWNEELLLVMERKGFTEEAYFTFSYSPIPDDEGAIGGVFCAVTEDTMRVLGRRRLATLRELAAGTSDGATTAMQACSAAAATLSGNHRDLPFALLYLTSTDGRAELAGASGVLSGSAAVPQSLSLHDPEASWPLLKAHSGGAGFLVNELADFGALRGILSPDGPRQAYIVPLAKTGGAEPAGFLIAGLSPCLVFDAEYRGFLDLAAGHVATAISHARAFEEEKKRAEALAELDRAKTDFFSNVSHEFRTPLTLMLGPLEDALRNDDEVLGPRTTDRLEVAHRNSVRLLKLVNTLLDFSRIEAGRIQAMYEPTDITALTHELASVFRSAFERAGLSLAVVAEPITAPVFVDREMWEKIVFNLLSNAFKFTLQGGVVVRVAQERERIAVSIQDTGIGIPPNEIEHVFERFHRVRGLQGRTHEGTGIGLALVQELVKLHGGTVEVESKIGRGSNFVVTIPTGSEHLPTDRIGSVRTLASTAIGAAPYVTEALGWLPTDAAPAFGDVAVGRGGASVSTRGARVLLADDNADMRQYLRRLLAEYWQVEAVQDGEEALVAIARTRPDLVLADVMMPKRDGFALVRAIRAEPSTRTLPVILLSARAGEEARVEGVGAGADDYVTKPFSARELVARINGHLELASVRREAAAIAEAARAEAERANQVKDNFLAMLSHELRSPMNAMLGWLRILKTAGARDPNLVERAVDTLEHNIWIQAQVINDLLDISRIMSGKLELEQARVDLASVVTGCVESLRPSAEGKHVTLHLDLAATDVDVIGDSARLQQVVTNILGNAIKFTEAGGSITVRVDRDHDDASVVVEDTGQGIDPEFLPHLFERFRQADTSRVRKHGGLGLGLAIVKNLVTLHGGDVRAESDGPGRGARFVVTLPMGEGRQRLALPAPALNVPSRAGALRRLQVLIVEDDADSREVLDLALGESGASVRSVDSVRGALAAYNADRPDVIISDIGMPEEDGYALIRAIREREEGRGYRTLAIAMTGFAGRHDREMALRAGFDDHIAKPVELDALVERVRVLEASRGVTTDYRFK